MPKVSKRLSKVEAHLIILAARQREATTEAANAAFNHAIKPVLDGIPLVPGTIPNLVPLEDGEVQIEYEAVEAEPAGLVLRPRRRR